MLIKVSLFLEKERVFWLLLFFTRFKWSITFITREHEARYCRLCQDHTMCLYTTDDEVNNSCELEEHLELDNEEIRLILDHHNHYRNHIAGGKEFRGDLGPQPAAKYMMQLTWDDELAFIAQHWANQCRLSSRDTCRDVERFGVCQNVHAVEIDRKEKMSGLEMIRLHIAAWYNQVEYFDNARVGLVNFAEWNHSSYIPLASAKITYVGCGRATYTLSFSEIPPTPHLLHSPLYLPSPLFLSHSIRDNPLPYLSFSKRVEVLVCNYGPINRSGPRELYEFGKPATCPPGTHTSAVYEFLCTNNSLEYPYEGSKPVTKLGKQRVKNLFQSSRRNTGSSVDSRFTLNFVFLTSCCFAILSFFL